MTWRLARTITDLRGEIDTRWPKRDTRSDGTIGDAAHATRDSDHNPWVSDSNGVGVVRALDVDTDGINAGWLAEHLRKLAHNGDHRLAEGGYIIFNHRITAADFSCWHHYTGSNPHTGHLHISVSRTRYDDGGAWGVARRRSGQAPRFPLRRGYYYGPLNGPKQSISGRYRSDTDAMRGGLRRWQQRLADLGWSITPDGIYGPQTRHVTRRFQEAKGLTVDGLIDPDTWRAAWES